MECGGGEGEIGRRGGGGGGGKEETVYRER